MVQKVVFLASSLKDLDNIRFFISSDSDFYAEQFVNTLVKEALKIGKMPEGGGIVRELGILLLDKDYIKNTVFYT